MRLRSRVAVAVVSASNYSSDLIPYLGTSICHRCAPPPKKKKERKEGKLPLMTRSYLFYPSSFISGSLDFSVPREPLLLKPERLWHLNLPFLPYILIPGSNSCKCVQTFHSMDREALFSFRRMGVVGRQGLVLLRSKAFLPDSKKRRLHTLHLLRNQRCWIS